MPKLLLDAEILRTLSFMEPMGLEHLFLDFDKDFLESNHDLTYEDLLISLKRLQKLKKVRLLKDGEQKLWIKIFPKRSWWKRIFSF